jgi:hypothetical protein
MLAIRSVRFPKWLQFATPPPSAPAKTGCVIIRPYATSNIRHKAECRKTHVLPPLAIYRRCPDPTHRASLDLPATGMTYDLFLGSTSPYRTGGIVRGFFPSWVESSSLRSAPYIGPAATTLGSAGWWRPRFGRERRSLYYIEEEWNRGPTKASLDLVVEESRTERVCEKRFGQIVVVEWVLYRCSGIKPNYSSEQCRAGYISSSQPCAFRVECVRSNHQCAKLIQSLIEPNLRYCAAVWAPTVEPVANSQASWGITKAASLRQPTRLLSARR